MSVQGKDDRVLTSREGIEQAELTGPWQRWRRPAAAGAVATSGDKVAGVQPPRPADTFPVDRRWPTPTRATTTPSFTLGLLGHR
jgi:hypothetical protein